MKDVSIPDGSLERIRELCSVGIGLRTVSAMVGKPYSSVYALVRAHKIPWKRWAKKISGKPDKRTLAILALYEDPSIRLQDIAVKFGLTKQGVVEVAKRWGRKGRLKRLGKAAYRQV
jgi:hypothetical protein